MSIERNPFAALAGMSTHAAEDYLTESFALLIRHLLAREPDAGLAIINQLSKTQGQAAFADASAIRVQTQLVDGASRPDLVFSDSERLIYVEIKHDAALSDGQLEKYWELLQASGRSVTRLSLLTRSRATALTSTLDADKYQHLCWYEIHRGLRSATMVDPVCAYLTKAFKEFLVMKGMNLTRVGWEYLPGVSALINLSDMLWAAIEVAMPGCKLRATSGWGWRGVAIDGSYYCGIRYAQPMTVVFEDNGGTNPSYKRDLDLDATHFFALDGAEQFELLTDFVRRAAEGVG